jgi:hypothetical protein
MGDDNCKSITVRSYLMYSPGRMEQNTEAVGSRLHAIPDRISSKKI